MQSLPRYIRRRESYVPSITRLDAAQMVAASDDPGIAAIAAPQCADLYNLSPLMRNIQIAITTIRALSASARDFHVYQGLIKSPW